MHKEDNELAEIMIEKDDYVDSEDEEEKKDKILKKINYLKSK
mgnify:CR=1 FL=1